VIIPCIDLMGGKVVQLVQGREKALEGEPPLETLSRFKAFPEIQIIDLDAAIGSGSNEKLIELLAPRAVTRIGGGVRSAARARRLVDCGAAKVIIGTAAFEQGVLESIRDAVGRERIVVALDSKHGRIVIKGWRESTPLTAIEALPRFEPYCSGFLCTYVDKEGMMQGTDLDWFRRLRSATTLELTAAGGITTFEEIRQLDRLGIHAALGMTIYTGKLDLADLAALQATGLSRRAC
jgi:phosphoribosylformimino-5-aminoimidazole carboxamide ribotide isomerase